MDKISRGVWPTHYTKTSMSPTVSSKRTCRLPACLFGYYQYDIVMYVLKLICLVMYDV